MIIDCHTHWGGCWERRDHGSPEQWLKILDRHSVDRAWLMCEEGLMRSDRCIEDNNRIARIARQYPDRFVPFGSVWPQQGEQAIAEVKRGVETLGMKGLKFHPWIQGFSTADETFGKICQLAGEFKIPVVFHDGTPPYSLAEQVAGLARRFPATRIILGHSGILWNWRSALAAAKLPNIYLCLCGPTMRAIEIICKNVSPEKLLWGSDFGFGFADTISYRLDLLSEAGITSGLRLQILDKNPRSIFSERI
ncbi:MAG: amidohydrolase family protein [Victivallaceae bacterium]|nr:amidohydrolase family protein [Victivallaceae bacterium]